MREFEEEISEAIESAMYPVQITALNKLKERYAAEADERTQKFFTMVAIASRLCGEFYNDVCEFKQEPDRDKLRTMMKSAVEMVKVQEEMEGLK
jgi:hypothetical protein